MSKNKKITKSCIFEPKIEWMIFIATFFLLIILDILLYKYVLSKISDEVINNWGPTRGNSTYTKKYAIIMIIDIFAFLAFYGASRKIAAKLYGKDYKNNI